MEVKKLSSACPPQITLFSIVSDNFCHSNYIKKKKQNLQDYFVVYKHFKKSSGYLLSEIKKKRIRKIFSSVHSLSRFIFFVSFTRRDCLILAIRNVVSREWIRLAMSQAPVHDAGSQNEDHLQVYLSQCPYDLALSYNQALHKPFRMISWIGQLVIKTNSETLF